MNTFTGDRARCPKCGGRNISVQYDTERGMDYGKLRRTCPTCRYSWHEEPLDEAAQRTPSGDGTPR